VASVAYRQNTFPTQRRISSSGRGAAPGRPGRRVERQSSVPRERRQCRPEGSQRSYGARRRAAGEALHSRYGFSIFPGRRQPLSRYVFAFEAFLLRAFR